MAWPESPLSLVTDGESAVDELELLSVLLLSVLLLVLVELSVVVALVELVDEAA